MKRIVILTTNTLHHRYFINTILENNIIINKGLFETEHVKPKFRVGPFYEKEEIEFEKDNFFKKVDDNLKLEDVDKVDNINSSPSYRILKDIKPDFGIVFGTGIIRSKIIKLFKDGLINVHRGVAQRYRGLDSDLWAIYHSDYENIGVTIHKVERTLDTGEIIGQQRLKILKNMKIYQIRYYTTLIATDLVVESVKNYLDNILKWDKQEKRGRYYSFMPLVLKKTVAKKFHRFSERLDA